MDALEVQLLIKTGQSGIIRKTADNVRTTDCGHAAGGKDKKTNRRKLMERHAGDMPGNW